MWLVLGGLGLVVILLLAFYAGRLLSQVKAQNIAKEVAKQELLAGQQAHDFKIMSSVLIIARAMKEEQCDYSEGCWRISVLLDSLVMSKSLEQEFPAIFGLYHQIKHLNILTERKSLEKRERMKQDVDRMKAEAALYDDINTDLTLLLQYSQERLTVLKPA